MCKEAQESKPSLKSKCCGLHMLQQEPDFICQENSIAEIAKQRGHIMILLPMFHPEFNPIELCWGLSKRTTLRVIRANPNISNSELLQKIHDALNGIALHVIRRKVADYCTLYKSNVAYDNIEKLMAQKISHRKTAIKDLQSVT
ncbi:hypothetical protein HDU97_008774, partial [Phlyctochytrium planicorne]